jgi:hypothetical protein
MGSIQKGVEGIPVAGAPNLERELTGGPGVEEKDGGEPVACGTRPASGPPVR